MIQITFVMLARAWESGEQIGRPFRHARYLKCGAFRRPEIRPEMFQGLPERQRTRGFREDGEWLFQLNTPPGGNFPVYVPWHSVGGVCFSG
jgi:hypothetical protein